MSTQYAFGQIVTNGLVLSLDAADQNSYSGSGTAWNDLSGNNNTGILTNGPTYTSTFGGGITFDGTNDIVTGSSTINIPGTVSLCAWVRHTTVPAAIQRYVNLRPDIAAIRHDGTVGVGTFMFIITTGGTIKSNSVSNAIVVNTNYYFCGTWDGTTMRIYQNGVQVGTPSTPGGTMSTSNLPYLISSPTECLNGSIFCTQVYNRALSATEILQNYNAQKSRFGL
jgi:hypothetical protein